MFSYGLRHALSRPVAVSCRRSISTLEGNSHIYVFPDSRSLNGHILSLLPTDPPTRQLALGITSKLPPGPESFEENRNFLPIVDGVLSEYATQDPEVKAKAAAMASESGANLGSGGVFFPHQRRTGSAQRANNMSSDAGGGANAQGGMGSGGRGGWIHVSDQRNPPDWGRVAWPEDIFGSLEVDGQGQFVEENGNYQPSGESHRMPKTLTDESPAEAFSIRDVQDSYKGGNPWPESVSKGEANTEATA